MSNFYRLIFFCILVLPSIAFGSACDDIGTGQAHPPVSIDGMTVCFVYIETPLEKEGQLSRDPEGVAIYSFSKGAKPVLVYELPYAGTTGRVNDVFIFPAGVANKDMLFVMHSIDAPRSWDVLNEVYDVNVFSFDRGALIRDDRHSGFFDMGGDMNDSKGRLSYIYPYKDRVSIEKVVRSPLFELAADSSSIDGVVKGKSLLYGSGGVPIIQEPSRMYLIKGDKVSVDDSVAGWCQVTYTTRKKPIRMWMLCESIAFTKR